MPKPTDRNDNIVSLVPKAVETEKQISVQITELLSKLTEINVAGGLTTLCVIGIKDGGVLTTMVTQDHSLTLIGALDVGMNNLMDEIYEEMEEVALPMPPSK